MDWPFFFFLIKDTDQTSELKEHLSAISALVEEAVKRGSRPVQDALYTGLQAIFGKIGTRLCQRGNDQALDTGELEGALGELADRLLFRDLDPTVEGLRTKRAKAANEYIAVSRQTGFVVGESARQSIAAWLARERAAPVQRILNDALRKLDE